jgi:hypothetical protein
LPASVEDLMAARKAISAYNLNDHVEAIHLRLWSRADYRALLEAVYDDDATEGSLSYDNYKAAEMIREFARVGSFDPTLEHRRLASIVKALNVVLNRYHMSRKERARTVGGEIVLNVPNVQDE